MAPSFEHAVIAFVSLDEPACDESISWLLWPVLAWRVIGPKVGRRSLNVFQRAVLGLSTASRRTVEEVAKTLRLHGDLVALIFKELEQMGALNGAYQPTDRGRAMLAEEEEDLSEDLVVGHVFADPFTGRFWPRLIGEDLRPVESRRTAKGWPVLKLGSMGSPRTLEPFVVGMPEPQPRMTKPTATVILSAARAHARDLRGVRSAAVHPGAMGRASCLDEQPSSYLLLVRVRHDGFERLVDDPFGVGASDALAKDIEARELADAEAGRAHLREWLRRGEPTPGSDESLRALHARAERLVGDRLPRAALEHPSLFARLAAMQRAALEAAQPDSPKDKRDDVSIKAQKSVEHALRLVGARWFRPECEQLLASDPAYNAALVEAIARDCGFETPLPYGIRKALRDGLSGALANRAGSLRAPLGALVLSALGRPEHPARAIARKDPRFLKRLDALAATRNRDAHDSPDARRADLERVVEVTFYATELLIQHCL
jgi:hypothetical protein